MIDRTRGFKDTLWVLVFCGALAVAFRLIFGLGSTTNLTDNVPWGLWKILNMVAGVALSTGGFTIGFLVYVLRLDRYRPLIKPAILIAFLGYGSSVTALLFDIGLPHRIWHPIVMWNGRSFLFEVAICVMCYFTLTIVELAPTIIERTRFSRIGRWLHRIAFGVVLVGISLSSLHHSSLGSLFLVTPARLHPLWYTPLLPLLFILSAIGAGMMVVVLIRILYAHWYHPAPVFGPRSGCAARVETNGSSQCHQAGPEMPRLVKLCTVAVAVLLVYFVLKLYHLVTSDAWASIVRGDWESMLYCAELLLSVIVPLALVVHPRSRRSPFGIGVAASTAALGLLLNRLNVGIFGYFRDAGTVYFPSLAEWALSLGIIAAAVLVFFAMVEHYPIFDNSWTERLEKTQKFHPSFDRLTRVWNTALASGPSRVTLIAVLTIPLAFGFLYPPFSRASEQSKSPVRPPVAEDQERTVLRIDGNGRGQFTTFEHAKHQLRLGGKSACGTCHHLALPGDHATPCARCHREMEQATGLFDHTAHFTYVSAKQRLAGLQPTNHSCAECHEKAMPKSAANAKPCVDCHKEDMSSTRKLTKPFGMAQAVSYRRAMHGTCIPCHANEAAKGDRKQLADCSTCHR